MTWHVAPAARNSDSGTMRPSVLYPSFLTVRLSSRVHQSGSFSRTVLERRNQKYADCGEYTTKASILRSFAHPGFEVVSLSTEYVSRNIELVSAILRSVLYATTNRSSVLGLVRRLTLYAECASFGDSTTYPCARNQESRCSGRASAADLVMSSATSLRRLAFVR